MNPFFSYWSIKGSIRKGCLSEYTLIVVVVSALLKAIYIDVKANIVAPINAIILFTNL